MDDLDVPSNMDDVIAFTPDEEIVVTTTELVKSSMEDVEL